MSDVVRIEGLDVSFATDRGAVNAVAGVDLAVGAGEILAVVGESGSGKTVTARTILGLLPETASTAGRVILTSRDRASEADVVTADRRTLRALRGRDVAMVFQEPSSVLNPVRTIGWQLAEGIRAHERMSRAEAKRRAVEILGKVGIPDPGERVDHYPHQFSGGQKQRIVIAMALVLRPGVIVADEPTTALDVTVQAEILDLLRVVRDEFDTSVLLITHNMGVVADLADRVVVMYQGRIVEQAPTAELFAAPSAAYTRDLLAAVPHVGQGKSADPGQAARGERLAAGEVVVAARQLRVQYPGRLGRPGFVAVPGADLEIRAGEVLGLVGESGSGKSTIGRAIAGLAPVTGGSLSVLGTELAGARERELGGLRRDLGFVFQDPGTSFNPLRTIAAAVGEPLVVHGDERSPEAVRRRVGELLEAVQLPKAFADRFPHELSGGQRQRASLARALALRPRLVVADEPTSALDVSVQARVLDLFAELQAELKFACLFISHDLAVVDRVADRVAVLHRGEIVEQGPGAQVLAAPEHPYTARLLAALPVPDPAEQAERRARRRELEAEA